MPGVINKTSIWPEQIVHEDNHILIINKLPSEIVQGDKTGDLPLSEKIKTFLKYSNPSSFKDKDAAVEIAI